jgi:lysophospholipase L1-like esterase
MHTEQTHEAQGEPWAGAIWHDALAIGVEGKAWHDTSRFCQRLPDRVQAKVRPELWQRALTPCGFCVHFRTNATAIWARWELIDPAGPIMKETLQRVSGLDLYARDAAGRWRWCGFAVRENDSHLPARMAADLDGAERDYKLYLPLQNAVASLDVGVPQGASFGAIAPRADPPLVFYGTSIVHGGAASRPGMAHVSILGRRLDWPVINLGFPGQGRMDLELAELLGELEAALFMVDCLPNMSAELVAERAEPFVRRLRQARPQPPVVLVESPDDPRAAFSPPVAERMRARRAALRAAYGNLTAAGIGNLHYVEGAPLFGADGEATLDGVHPSDVGFLRMADALEPLLRRLLQKRGRESFFA